MCGLTDPKALLRLYRARSRNEPITHLNYTTSQEGIWENSFICNILIYEKLRKRERGVRQTSAYLGRVKNTIIGQVEVRDQCCKHNSLR